MDWAAGDEVYGRSSKLRGFFEEHAIGYVFAVGINFQVPVGVGPMRADLLAARKIPKRAWNRLSCGQGAKGPRVYDWALVATANPRHHLLVRRSLADPTDLAFFYTYVPPGAAGACRRRRRCGPGVGERSCGGHRLQERAPSRSDYPLNVCL